MVRPEPSKGAAGRAPKTIANSWRAHIPSTCGSTTAPSLLTYRWKEAVEQFNGARGKGLEYQNAMLVGLGQSQLGCRSRGMAGVSLSCSGLPAGR